MTRGGYGGRSRGNSRFRNAQRPSTTAEITNEGSSANCQSDIATALNKISDAVTTLSKRLDNLEKNRGPDNNPGRNTGSTRHVNAGPPTTFSLNNDFASVSKCIYRLVQLNHHNKNWEQLPKSLTDRIQRLASDINPPMIDDELRRVIRASADKFGQEIADHVRVHLRRKIAEKETEAGRLNPADIDRAKSVAAKYVDVRLGKRLEVGRRAQLLDVAAATVGRFRHPPPSTLPTGMTAAATTPTVVRQPTNGNAWTTVGSPRRPPADSRKRILSTPDTTPTNNRFDVLADDTDSIQTDVEPDVEDPRPRVTPGAPKKARKTATTIRPKAADREVEIWNGPKDQWTIQPLPTTRMVVIGDSNLRLTPEIPEGWQIFCLPGARIHHVREAVDRLSEDLEVGQFDLAIQAGINHRDDTDDSVCLEIDELVRDARDKSCVGTIYHMGVSATKSMSQRQQNSLQIVNDRFKFQLDEACTEALPVDDVETTDDPHGIHYTPKTIDLLIKSLMAKTSCLF